MAIIKENQPVKFNLTSDACSQDVSDYTQLVDNTDDTQFQLGLTLCNGQENVLPSPNFEDAADYYLGVNWTISGGLLCASGLFNSGCSAAYVFDSTLYYNIIIEVDSITSGSEFTVKLGANTLGTITKAGTYEFFGTPSIYIGTYLLYIIPSNATDVCCISSINAYPILTNFIIPIYDSDNNYINEINYNDDPTYFSFVKDSVTITIDWSALGLADSCYYLGLLDPCANNGGQNYPASFTNGTFTGSATGWDLGASWTYSSNTVVATYSGSVSSADIIAQSSVFVNYTTTFSVSVDITAITGTLEVYFGTNLVATLNSTGVHVVTGECVDNLDFSMVITSGTATVTEVFANEVASANYVLDAQTNLFKLSDYINICPNTLLINACNSNDAMGFVFEDSGFSPRVRLLSKLKQSNYKYERIREETSEGEIKNAYYNRRKSKLFVADLLPEYIHDFLSTLAGYDKFYIDDVAYVVDDEEYNVTYDDSQDNIGSIAIRVSEQIQLIKNINCDDEDVSCTLGENYLLNDLYLDQYITLANGELIVING